jgi:hypothetical protein
MVVDPTLVILGVGNAFTTIFVGDEVVEHPAAFVTVTVRAPAVVTTMDGVVAPVLHKYDEPALAVNVTLAPAHKLVFPLAVMLAVGNAFTVTTVAIDVAVQPVLFES